MDISRKHFIKTGFIVAAGIAPHFNISALPIGLSSGPRINIFSKCLQFLNYDEMAEVIARLGFNGVDLTVRHNGHVQPGKVAKELPRAVKALQKVGKEIPVITTDITDAHGGDTENILGTASSLGIQYYRMGRLKYDASKSIVQNLDGHKFTLENLEKLNRKYQIHGCIQNHSGPYNMVGAPIWDLYCLLKDFNPKYTGVQYDIMHATVEGGYSWALGLELISPWIKSIDIKDFLWGKSGSGKWEAKIVPLGEGMVDFDQFRKEVKRLDITATYSIHYEYDLGGAESGLEPTISKDKICQKISKDLSFFKAIGHSIQ